MTLAAARLGAAAAVAVCVRARPRNAAARPGTTPLGRGTGEEEGIVLEKLLLCAHAIHVEYTRGREFSASGFSFVYICVCVCGHTG